MIKMGQLQRMAVITTEGRRSRGKSQGETTLRYRRKIEYTINQINLYYLKLFSKQELLDCVLHLVNVGFQVGVGINHDNTSNNVS